MDPALLRLVAITDRHNTPGDWIGAIAEALEGGVTALMLREKDMTARDLYAAALQIRPLTQRAGAALLISDRVDVALAVGADAVHLGWTSLPIAAAREVIQGRCGIGFSAHNLREAGQAVAEGADYLTYAPIFPTPSKQGYVPVVGLEGLREAVQTVPLPLVALGGINEGNVEACVASGVAGIAAIRAIFGQPDIEAAASRLAEIVKSINY